MRLGPGRHGTLTRMSEVLRNDALVEFALQALDHGVGSIEDERTDAVIVEFYERGDEHCGVFAQRFRPGSEARPLEPIGNPAFIGEQAPLF